jgi:xylan 1,4-beta-xylosidase
LTILSFECDLDSKKIFFSPYWKFCVGSGHAALALREDWRCQLRKVREELGFNYVRFHGLLNDDMSVCTGTPGKIKFSFSKIYSVFDYLLEIGMRPFVELSFMPSLLASGKKTVFQYKGNITPPKDFNQWALFIESLIRSLIKRYGLSEVKMWLFEVWNEPNLEMFWSASQKDYFKLYECSVLAIKKVSKDLRVGGPATAGNGWIKEFINFCHRKKLPFDFITSHSYPTDIGLGEGLNMKEALRRSEREILRELVLEGRRLVGDFPLYYTEWNASPSSRDPYHDSPYMAAFIMKTLLENIGVVDAYSFWTFSDIFEEEGFCSIPFHGGFGLLNINGIPKPSYRAFEILKDIGTQSVRVKGRHKTVNVFVVTDEKKNTGVLIATNHNLPAKPIKREKVRILVKSRYTLSEFKILRIDEKHSNPLGKWKAWGQPRILTEERVDLLIKESNLKKEPFVPKKQDKYLDFEFDLPAHGSCVINFKIKK